MSELIVEDLGEWNSAVVRQLFSVVEVDLILSIPLSKRLPEIEWCEVAQEMGTSRSVALITV